MSRSDRHRVIEITGVGAEETIEVLEDDFMTYEAAFEYLTELFSVEANKHRRLRTEEYRRDRRKK